MNIHTDSSTPDLALWGGLECTVNRVRDNYFSQMDRNGHAGRLQDIERFASLGIQAIRYPVLWERTAPDGVDKADWSWPDERLPALRQLGVTPIVGLVHHGSGPRHTSLIDPAFPDLLAEYAGAVAARYPWVEYYTPVNEICTTARFSGLAGVWYPHGGDEATFIRALLVQCRATVLSMRAIRAVNPQAKLVQTDDLSKTYGTPEMEEITSFFNERRWLAWDLLCGMIDENHKLWSYLLDSGAGEEELRWFRENPCPPDVVGVNYYITSERWLDHRPERYPASHRHVYRGVPHADIEAPRALATPTPGIAPLLMETWERYGLPIAITEAHIDANREDQMRWLLEIWNAALKARQQGADVRAVTVWALLGSFDWNCLVTECRGYYEPGPFDVRGPAPRPTAVATLMRELASKRPLSNPVLQGEGWWRRPGRFLCKPVATRTAVADIAVRSQFKSSLVQPILISGASGTLGSAFKRICEKRNLACHVLTRQEMDITDPASVEAAIVRFKPWAIVNAGGYVRVDEAEADFDRCMRENTLGPTVLALACIRHALRFMTFSSDLVFDGAREQPYVESDLANPLGVYGRSKLEAEQRVLDADPQALVIRTSSFFGPWDQHNFVTQALNALDVGLPFQAARDVTVSPTYVPDLVNVSLDLLIDRERGIWHLTNGEAVSWFELARRACAAAGVSSERLQEVSIEECGYAARRPGYSALSSERGLLLPSLDDALKRYVEAVQERANGVSLGHEQAGEAAHYAR
ncbi:family 1 glycosylhydrolase [Massilia timonae]|uniref:dTDP-4-dehydrorhamnose reductase n=1 Tax=Massilia timonae TaxID=47229 RepID=A0A1S2NF22_9BURK|nr:family 1 glycosylhydrolase [Massilia timonae]OIJ43667.1 3-beta hydroxysteroid dehydrogenase/isomerase family protein [Massilia timonae]